MKLDTQVFVSHTKPEPHLIQSVENELFWKPRKGGLWTSTLDDDGGGWMRWLDDQDYALDDERWGGKLWLLEPAEANVYVVGTPDDLIALHERFPLSTPPTLHAVKSFDYLVDWERVSEEYDAVHIPAPWGYRFMPLSLDTKDFERYYSASMFFYVMDAECTCWFRWCFEGEPRVLERSLIAERLGS